jgi:hypothetical protein
MTKKLRSRTAAGRWFEQFVRVREKPHRTADPSPRDFKLDLNAPLRGTMIYLRRSDDHGDVSLLAQSFHVTEHWPHRLVRCEVDFTHQRLCFYALRRRDPSHQPLLHELPYHRPNKPFQGPL